ncbi:MAG: MBL fold metallo-hydrolase [Anaerolineae bacterium]|nr:MBL fold metallo-hydrolase [Anaerolineae bacterium]MDQ7036311.1 MBL fold metallo-hydrolase [Anaerolineae bacterium]
MDITWYGLSCFRLIERGQTTVVTDPYSESIGLPIPNLKGDVVTVSHDEAGHNGINHVKNYEHILSGPGEYEIGGVFITGLAMHHIDNEQEIYRRNVSYLIKYPSDLTVLHLGDLSHIPDQSTIEGLGEVHVALVPVGGGNTLSAAMAAEVIALIEPNYIVPMHYAMEGLNLQLDTVDKFLKAMGVSRVQEDETLRVLSSSLPEQPEVVVLLPQIGD